MISAFDIRLSRWYLRLPTALNVYFAICASKTLQKSSATQKISLTLSSVIIAKFFCFIVFFHYKVTKNFADYQIFNELYFIELTLEEYIDMAQNYYESFKKKLEEIFMMDHAELDFGIYRIMNQKRNDIQRFLDLELLPQVKQVLEGNNGGEADKAKKRMAELTAAVGGN